MWFCPLYVFDGMKRGRRRPNCVEDCISDNSPVQDTQGEYPSCLPSLTPLPPSPPARSKGSVCINITCRVILQPRACVHYLSIRGAAGEGEGRGNNARPPLVLFGPSSRRPLVGSGGHRSLIGSRASDLRLPIGQTEITPVYKLDGIS